MTPDHITPEQALASAYLDGDVTPAERARVDAAPELLALVASMRHVAGLIAAVPAPIAARRESGIAAALDVFDRLESGQSEEGGVVSLASRRRFSKAVLSAAAAVLLVGVVGISVLSNNSSNDKSDSASREADTKLAEPTAEDAATGAADESNGGEVMVTLAAPVAIENLEELAALTLPEPPADGMTPAATTADTTAAGNDVDTQRLESFNIEALACMSDTQVFLADIYYQGMLAIAVRDTVTDVTEAIDSTCTVLARVTP